MDVVKNMLGKESYGTYTDAKGHRIVKGDVVIPNVANKHQHGLPLGSKWKIEKLIGEDVDLIGVGNNNRGKRTSLGTYNIIRIHH